MIRKPPPGYLSTDQVMEQFGCSRTTLYRMMHEGEFTTEETLRFRGKRIFRKEAIDRIWKKYIDLNN